MALETFKLRRTLSRDALANGLIGSSAWPKTPPTIAPLPSGATLWGWYFQGNSFEGGYSLTEVYQSSHGVGTRLGFEPTYEANQMITSPRTSLFQGIELPVLDSNPMTLILVVRNKYTAGQGNTMLAHCATPTTTDRGFNIIKETAVTGVQFRTRTGALGGTTLTTRYNNTTISSEKYLLMGLSQTATTRVASIYGMTPAGAGNITDTGQTINPSGRPIILGNGYDTGWGNGTAKSLEIAACFYMDVAATAAELTAMSPSIVRAMARRRVPVYGP